MSKINKILGLISLIFLLVFPFQLHSQEGEERVGQAGAFELLINPWARSSGLSGANTASVRGIESVYLNVAGLTGTDKTEIHVFKRGLVW